MITNVNIPKLCIPFNVCHIGFPSSNLVQTGISIIANKISNMMLIATAPRDYVL